MIQKVVRGRMDSVLHEGTLINRDPKQEAWPDDGLRDILRPQHPFLVEHQATYSFERVQPFLVRECSRCYLLVSVITGASELESSMWRI
jgi:hypothetical protein